MEGGQGVGLLGAILALRPELPQPRLPPLADDGLGDQAPEHLLTRWIEPCAGKAPTTARQTRRSRRSRSRGAGGRP